MSQPQPERKVRFNCLLPESMLRRLRLAAAADRRDMTNLLLVTLDRTLPPLPMEGVAESGTR